MPEQMTASPEQIQQAAATGLQLLAQPDLKVPMNIAMSGNLILLQGLLQSLANGSLGVGLPNQISEGDPPSDKEQVD